MKQSKQRLLLGFRVPGSSGWRGQRHLPMYVLVLPPAVRPVPAHRPPAAGPPARRPPAAAARRPCAWAPWGPIGPIGHLGPMGPYGNHGPMVATQVFCETLCVEGWVLFAVGGGVE